MDLCIISAPARRVIDKFAQIELADQARLTRGPRVHTPGNNASRYAIESAAYDWIGLDWVVYITPSTFFIVVELSF
jgi:hypothetical protein